VQLLDGVSVCSMQTELETFWEFKIVSWSYIKNFIEEELQKLVCFLGVSVFV